MQINRGRWKGSPTDWGSKNVGPGQMAPWLKVLIAKPGGLGSVPEA